MYRTDYALPLLMSTEITGRPYPGGEGQHEGEHLRLGRLRLAKKDPDAEVHERCREVHRALALRCHGQVCYGKVLVLRTHIMPKYNWISYFLGSATEKSKIL